MRRKYLVSVLLPVVAAVVLITSCTTPLQPPVQQEPTELTRVNVQLGWIPNSEFAGLFAADQLGYYEEEGLEVDFISGGAGIDPITIVRQNQDFIGVVSSNPSLINAVSRGAPLVAIGAFYQFHPNGFLILKESGIATWKDLEGKKVGVQAEGEYLLDVVAAVEGLDKSKMEVVRVGYDPTPLLTGQIDAYMAWVVNQPYKVEQADKEWDFLLLADVSGVEFYAMLPFVHKDLLESDPDLVERWTCASLRGWAYVLDHPDEAAEWTVEHYLEAGDLEAERWLLEQANPITRSENTAEHGLGWMDPGRWERAITTLLEHNQIEKPVAVEDIMTNQFVETCGIKR